MVGDFCGWDGAALPDAAPRRLRRLRALRPRRRAGRALQVRDPDPGRDAARQDRSVAPSMERPPGNGIARGRASILRVGRRRMDERRGAGRQALREPMPIYEVHLGSWARVPEEGNRSLTYREIAPRLVEHSVGSASPTSSCCRSWSIRSTARGATRSPATTRRRRASARPTTSASSSTRCIRPESA